MTLPTKRAVLSERRHSEILGAARQVFARRGFDEASVDDIARAAGLAKGTLYLYYRSKRDLYWAALRDGLLALGEELERRVAAAQGIDAKIRAFVETKVRYFEEHRDFVRIYYAEFGNAVAHPCVPPQGFHDLYRQQMKVLTVALRAAVRQGVVPPLSVEPAAGAIFDLTRGVITRRLLGWSDSRPEADVESAVDLATRLLRPARRTR